MTERAHEIKRPLDQKMEGKVPTVEAKDADTETTETEESPEANNEEGTE